MQLLTLTNPPYQFVSVFCHNTESVKRILCFKLGRSHELTKQDDNDVSARRFPHLMTNMQSDIKMA